MSLTIFRMSAGACRLTTLRFQALKIARPGSGARACASLPDKGAQAASSPTTGPKDIVTVDHAELVRMSPKALAAIREAYVGPKAYGCLAVINIPGYGELRRRAFRSGIDLALLDADGRARAAAVSNTYPGWSGTPGSETHPLQSSFLFNVKEELRGRPDPYFGKNIFPSEEYRKNWTELTKPMHETALSVLRGCDIVMEEFAKDEGFGWSAAGKSMYGLADKGPALAARFICYDSGFTREDTLLNEKDNVEHVEQEVRSQKVEPPSRAQVMAMSAGHAGDGLASMRTHTTPVKSAGHAADGLASMRTHSTPIKSAGHAGDGLASMRTHSTPVKSAGHAGDGLASMRTHSTPVKSAGHAGDGLASMRTHSTPVKSAGHAGDGLASMRTHSTPVKSAGHAGDGLASMRTHSTPVKSAGHAGDGLASMRTHSTPVKSAGHAGDGLASMRTHATPVKSAGHAGDGLASMRTHSTPVKSAGHAEEDVHASIRSLHTSKRSMGDGLSSVHTSHNPMTPLSSSGDSTSSVRAYTTSVQTDSTSETMPLAEGGAEEGFGDYWLPWHIDSNFVTLIHKEMYARESDAAFVEEPRDAGVVFMNEVGDVVSGKPPDDAMILQLGAFAQIYAGGHMKACRHAVINPRPPGVARFNFCNFWYAEWDTLCHAPEGMEHQAINKGWNAMMDESYLDISMKNGFAAFREFMTSPEARVQFADSVGFKELSQMLPMPGKEHAQVFREHDQTALAAARPDAEVVVDVLTDLRCPFSFIANKKLEAAMKNLGLDKSAVRYHPVFLNPNVPREGESLDDYLLREYGYSREYAHSEDYPLYQAGLEVGVRLNPNRRVVNTFDAACAVELAQSKGRQQELVEEISRRYFERAEDISDEEVLCDALEAVGISGSASELMRARGRVAKRYAELGPKVGEVPHFVIRERASGNGLELSGTRSVEEWEATLKDVLKRGSFMGVSVRGHQGSDVWLANGNPSSPVSLAYPAQHGWEPGAWPYTESDFSRMDENDDSIMYEAPRMVNHLEDASISSLTDVYRSFFRAAGPDFAVLDMCSSWTSHFPAELMGGARVVAHGLNEEELKQNKQASEYHVQDLNSNPLLPWDSASFDFVTIALSVQYLTKPQKVFSEIHRLLKPGGVALVAYSNRCFLEKTVNVWANEVYDGEGHAHILRNYFLYSSEGGWAHISSTDVSPRHGDPLWLISAVKS
eukprot:TRINITY_DN9123_c0_g1_i1.p1 TRINITY_DN9123_c0_g1~~TRINITY_DN9123_c0_g1_i1.p1  ORF type:complete len:1204 (+),score=178.77 TRINITY_DN9123_c0_g1_i1:275-3886(+)